MQAEIPAETIKTMIINKHKISTLNTTKKQSNKTAVDYSGRAISKIFKKRMQIPTLGKKNYQKQAIVKNKVRAAQ